MCDRTADDHVLRIAGDRCGAANIRGHRDPQQIRDGMAPEPGHKVKDERRQDQANGVVH